MRHKGHSLWSYIHGSRGHMTPRTNVRRYLLVQLGEGSDPSWSVLPIWGDGELPNVG